MAPTKYVKLSRSCASSNLWRYWSSSKMHLLSLIAIILGPLGLIYLALRCEKNMCVLFQMPLVIPSLFRAYFSLLAIYIVLGFILGMFIVSLVFSRLDNDYLKKNEIPSTSQGVLSLGVSSMLLLCVAYLKPEYITLAHNEFLRMVTTTTIFCFVASLFIFLLGFFNIVDGKRDYSFFLAFFFGNHTSLFLKNVELKYFFYVHVGLVAWGLLDLLLLLNVVVQRSITAPVIFLSISQYLVCLHTLMFESFLRTRPFVQHEGLGFFWLMRVLMFLPFFQVLPIYYAATTELTMPKPAMIADCVFFLFGFVIYISSIHQKENFSADPGSFRNLKSVASSQGKRFLTSGYWGIVQKPDYLGYLIMWLSWTIACGFSALVVLVFASICVSTLLMLQHTSQLKQLRYPTALKKYTSLVPNKIIPFIY